AAGLGLVPLLFGDIAGKELERPMAYVILGGLATSTFLNMLVVPILYLKWGWDPEEAWQRQLLLEQGDFLEVAPTPVRGGADGGSSGSATDVPPARPQ
ncbi:MAG: efflux RND transporter permease subunit, partial [Candidatus Methylomirabilales bacterium]